MATSLFVYGTLLSDGDQRGLLGAFPRRSAWVEGRLYDLPAGYPALVLEATGGEPRTKVHGEIVEPIDDRLLGVLDLYEGVPQGLYERRWIEVRVGLRTHPAWAYVMDAARARRGRWIPSGRWRPARRR